MRLIALEDIFNVQYGNQFDLYKLDKGADKGVNFVSRGANNLGVSCKVDRIVGIKPYSSGLITVSLGGSILSSFVQQEDFYTGQNIKVLTPKKEMTFNEKVFYCKVIELNKIRYSTFGREANKTLHKIKIPSPDQIPNYVYEVTVDIPSKTPVSKENLILKDREWRYFVLKDIFNIEKCKCSSAEELLVDGNDLFYVGAKKNENGIMRKVGHNSKLISKGNGIVFIGDGQGSIGYSLYQPKDFIGSSTLSIGYNGNLNIFNALFIVPILDKERYRYSFGRKYGKEVVKNSKIKLPVDKSNNPDWQFMGDYIKSLPYSSNL